MKIFKEINGQGKAALLIMQSTSGNTAQWAIN